MSRRRGPPSRVAGRCRALRLAVFVMAALAAALAATPGLAATASLSVDARTIHAGVPFTLTLSARGFEEGPEPAPPELAIEGGTVTYLGVSHASSTQITIVNGQVTEERDVTFDYRWRVVVPAAGTYRLPPLRVEQGAVVAITPAATIEAAEVRETADMIVRMRLPEDDVFVGETFDAAVEWLLAREVERYEFTVPLFEIDEAVVDAAPGTGRKVSFATGTGEVGLPLERGREAVRGRQYTRFTFPARITLARSGTFDLDPVRVAARLQTGEEHDRFGFRRPRYELFAAQGSPRRLTVRALPVAGRPASFVNAIGRGFSLEVAASRTVVSVGDPIELTLRLRGDAPLAGLSLPPLDGPDGLPAAWFGVPAGSVPGRVDAGTNTKLFTVTVRVKSEEAREVPPIAFSWFDPGAREYRTVRSRPIALSVQPTALVGAREVVAAPPAAEPRSEPSGGGAVATTAATTASLIGADMSLSNPAETLTQPWGSGGVRSGEVRIVLGVLYGAPVLLLLLAWWLARTRGRRARRRAIRSAFREVERALASGAPARDAAPAIVAAMRRLAEVTGAGRTSATAALERLETRAFDPAAAGDRVAADLIDALRAAARAWLRAARAGSVDHARDRGHPERAWLRDARPDSGSGPLSTMPAPEAAGAILDEARASYAEALEEADRQRRVRRFGAAEKVFRPLAAAHPGAAPLQVDWGNAALGAGDTGRAVLGYLRALRAMPDNDRALANLAWVRGRLPGWVPRPATSGAWESLLFWRGLLTATQLHLVGGAAFAMGMLALAGWLLTGRWVLRTLAVPVLAVWMAAAASAWSARPAAGEAVVMTDEVTLRSADSTGAAPAFGQPLPAGTEVTVVEARDAWVRVKLADGSAGWLAAGAVELVVAPVRRAAGVK